MSIIEDIEPCFEVSSFYDMYVLFNTKYEEMKFHDNISDGERIAEYKWINQQIRKYITNVKKAVLSHKNQDEMLTEIKNLISKTDDYGDSRKEIVYNCLRDDFLTGLYSIVELYQSEEDE